MRRRRLRGRVEKSRFLEQIFLEQFLTFCWCFRPGEEMMIPSEMPSVTMGENGHGNGKNDRDDDNDDDHGKDNDLDGNQLGLPRDVHHL